jgi:hypothetical protein
LLASNESIALRARCIRTKRIIGILPIRRHLAVPDCGVRSEINLSVDSLRATPSAQAGIHPAIPIEARRVETRFATCGL